MNNPSGFKPILKLSERKSSGISVTIVWGYPKCANFVSSKSVVVLLTLRIFGECSGTLSRHPPIPTNYYQDS